MKDLKERTHSHSAQYMRARKKRILRPHNDALFVAAVRVSNEDRSRLGNQHASRTRTDCTSKRHTPKSLTIALEPTAGRCDDND